MFNNHVSSSIIIIMYQICTVYTYYVCICIHVCINIYIYIYVCVVPAPKIYLGIYIYSMCVCAHMIYVSKICINSIIDLLLSTVQNPAVQPFPQPWPAVPDATRDKVQEGSATLWDVPWETSHGFPPGHDLEMGGFSMAMLVSDG